MLYTHKLPPLKKASFIKRYKRFLVDVSYNDTTETIHCPNSGSMKGLLVPDMPIWMSHSDNPKRRLRHTLEIVQPDKTLVGVHTQRANTIVYEALQAGLLQDTYAFTHIKKEAKVDASRLDFMLTTEKESVYLEVKNVTLRHEQCALFPDATTERGTKHVQLLTQLAQQGHKAGIIFLVQRNDCHDFSAAEEIDPTYAQALLKAQDHIYTHILWCTVTEEAITIDRHTTVHPKSTS